MKNPDGIITLDSTPCISGRATLSIIILVIID
jgi:hypothetical protein